eukprot:GHVT01025966.1.p1 GENE.GHVT01025966.1~~GHVT01025966.1.p1  ORF type:complete len:162 (-),score=12.31 GHVT01025966.1:331-762(-)
MADYVRSYTAKRRGSDVTQLSDQPPDKGRRNLPPKKRQGSDLQRHVSKRRAVGIDCFTDGPQPLTAWPPPRPARAFCAAKSSPVCPMVVGLCTNYAQRKQQQPNATRATQVHPSTTTRRNEEAAGSSSQSAANQKKLPRPVNP